MFFLQRPLLSVRNSLFENKLIRFFFYFTRCRWVSKVVHVLTHLYSCIHTAKHNSDHKCPRCTVSHKGSQNIQQDIGMFRQQGSTRLHSYKDMGHCSWDHFFRSPRENTVVRRSVRCTPGGIGSPKRVLDICLRSDTDT